MVWQYTCRIVLHRVEFMIIGACELEFYLPGVSSLKEKRSIVKPMTTRLRKQFNVAVAEIDHQDVWQSAAIGIVTVTNATAHADQMLSNIITWVEEHYPDMMIVRQSTEII